MNQIAGAVDQFIELINSFPKDDALITEAALYALAITSKSGSSASIPKP